VANKHFTTAQDVRNKRDRKRKAEMERRNARRNAQRMRDELMRGIHIVTMGER
jgi:hypothetical protein